MVWCAIGVVVAAVLLLLMKDFVFRSDANEASSSAYVQFVHAVYAEVNRIFLFAQRIGDYHEVRRILDEVSVTGQVDPEVRKYGRLPDPMLTCIVVQDFVMCYRRLGNRVAAGPFTRADVLVTNFCSRSCSDVPKPAPTLRDSTPS